MWVGATHQGLFRYSAGRFERYAPSDGLPGARVPVIAPGVDNGLWIGTDGGLVRFKKPRVTVYTQRDGLANDFVGSIFQDENGSVWAETGSELTRFVNGAFKVLTRNDGLPDGRVWLGSSADRLPLIYTSAGLARWTHDRFVLATEVAGIPWDRVSAAFEDRSGTLWIGIRDGGLMRVRDGHATHLTTKDGLADDSVHTFFEDRAGDPLDRDRQKRRDANLGRTPDVMVHTRWAGGESREGVPRGRLRDSVDWHPRRRPQPLQGREVRQHLGASGPLQRQRLSDSRRR